MTNTETPNPLAVGTFCTCGTRLQVDHAGTVKYPCPFGPHPEETS